MQTASWFLDLRSSKVLDLDPPYQRRSVWNRQYQEFFIDSVVRNYPAPSIFLQVEFAPQRPTKYHVIDGKQRLTALFEFYDDKFTTSDSLDDLGLGNKYFSGLDENVQTSILEYVFTVESIKQASTAELNQAFDRLNRNVARLTKQELRHAKYDGAFIKKIEALAEDEFWTEVGLVTPARIRRMSDVEYVSEFYAISMMGVQEGKDYLDEVYAQNDLEIIGEQEADRNFAGTRKALEAISEIFPLKSTRFSNVADFYSLWAAVSQIVRDGNAIDIESAALNLRKLNDELTEQRTERAKRYLFAAIQGSNKKANREARAVVISSAILGQ